MRIVTYAAVALAIFFGMELHAYSGNVRLYVAIDVSLSSYLNPIQIAQTVISGLPLDLAENLRVVEFASKGLRRLPSDRLPTALMNDLKAWNDVQYRRLQLPNCESVPDVSVYFPEKASQRVDVCHTDFRDVLEDIREFIKVTEPAQRTIVLIISDGEPSPNGSTSAKTSTVPWQILTDIPDPAAHLFELILLNVGNPLDRSRTDRVKKLWPDASPRSPLTHFQFMFESASFDGGPTVTSHVAKELIRMISSDKDTLRVNAKDCTAAWTADGSALQLMLDLQTVSLYRQSVQPVWEASFIGRADSKSSVVICDPSAPCSAFPSAVWPGVVDSRMWAKLPRPVNLLLPGVLLFAYRVPEDSGNEMHWAERSVLNTIDCRVDMPVSVDVLDAEPLRWFLVTPRERPFKLEYHVAYDKSDAGVATVSRKPRGPDHNVLEEKFRDGVPNLDIQREHVEDLEPRGADWSWFWSGVYTRAYDYTYPRSTAPVPVHILSSNRSLPSSAVAPDDLKFVYLGLDFAMLAALPLVLWVSFCCIIYRPSRRTHTTAKTNHGRTGGRRGLLSRFSNFANWVNKHNKDVCYVALLIGFVDLWAMSLYFFRDEIGALNSDLFSDHSWKVLFWIYISVLILLATLIEEHLKPRLVWQFSFGVLLVGVIANQKLEYAIVALLLRVTPPVVRHILHETAGFSHGGGHG